MVSPVQEKEGSTGASAAASLTITFNTPATAGNRIVVVGNSNATLTVTAGYNAVVSRVASNGSYIWSKIAAGGETSVVLTPSVSTTVVGKLIEYPASAAGAVDQTASTARSGSASNTQATGTTAATAQAAELVVVAACPHSFAAASPPNTPTWVTATGLVVPTPTSFGTSSNNVTLFVGNYTTTATGAQSDTCTWTNNSNDATGLIATFKLAASTPTTAADDLTWSEALARSGLTLPRGPADSLAWSEVLARAGVTQARATSDSLTLSEVLARAGVTLPRSAADSLALSEVLTRTRVMPRGITDSFLLRENVTANLSTSIRLSGPRQIASHWPTPRRIASHWPTPRRIPN